MPTVEDKAKEYIKSQTDINPDEILSGIDGLELKQDGELNKRSIDALSKAIEEYKIPTIEDEKGDADDDADKKLLIPSVDDDVVVNVLVDYGGRTGKQKIPKKDAEWLLKIGLAKCIE